MKQELSGPTEAHGPFIVFWGKKIIECRITCRVPVHVYHICLSLADIYESGIFSVMMFRSLWQRLEKVYAALTHHMAPLS